MLTKTRQINPVYYQQLGALPGDTISDKSAQNFERFPDGRMKWFSGPPLDVLDPAPLDHSLAFLKHKAAVKLEEEAAKKSDTKRGSPTKESRSPKKARVRAQKIASFEQYPLCIVIEQMTSPDANLSSGAPLPSSSPATSSPPTIVDWAPLTETLETLAGIWLKEADSLLMS
jgi:hypothetical protein